jgi:PAS domain S-box-containing protein
VTSERQAIFLNAIPLLVLGGLYLLAVVALAPSFWRERRSLRELDLTAALVFPSGGLAAIVLGALVLDSREPIGGHAVPALGGIVLAVVPVVAFFARWGDRTMLLTGTRRVREAEELTTAREREREGLSAFSSALMRTSGGNDVGRLIVDWVIELLAVDFAALALIHDREARGLVAVRDGQELGWWRDLRFDLDREPSAIASAAFEAAPFSVFDVASSPYVNHEVAAAVGARSGVWVPLIVGEQVIAVLAAVTTHRRHVFGADEVRLLQELADEAAGALDRTRSASALEGALERERLVRRITEKVRSELDPQPVLDAALIEIARALGLSRCFVRLGEPGGPMPIEAEWHAEGLEPIGSASDRLAVSNLAARDRRTIALSDIESAPELDDPSLGVRESLLELSTHAALAVPIVVFDSMIGVLSLHRGEVSSWTRAEMSLAETIAHELGLALHTARLLAENERQLKQQSALLQSAQAVTSELRLDLVLQRLVDEIADLLGADASDCYLFDAARGVFRCAAVHGLPPDLVGFEFPGDQGLSADAVRQRRAVVADHYGPSKVPHPAYEGYAAALVAPVVWSDEVRGVLGVGSRGGRSFSLTDLDVIEGFATLASLALRNAQAFEERGRQARVERGFFRIAAMLGQQLSFQGTVEAVVQAAAETLGADLAAVLLPRAEQLALTASSGTMPERLRTVLEGGLPASAAVLEAAAARKRILAAPALADDDRFDPEWRELVLRSGFRSLLAVPVEGPGEDERPGLALVLFAETRTFSDDDLELAAQLSQAARGALERSALYEEERTARRLAQELARTGALLATELDPAAVLEDVVGQAPGLVRADACAVRALEDGELVIVASGGELAEDMVGDRSPATGWLSGEVAQSRLPVRVDDARDNPRLLEADVVFAAGYRSYLGVPLAGAEGALHGVLAVYGRGPRAWRDAEVDALQALAVNATAALANAELYQRVASEQERSNAIIANIADGIVAVDREGEVVLWNRAAEHITGVPAAEAVGRPPAAALGRDLSPGAHDELVAVVRGGEEVWLSVTEAVMRDPGGTVAGRIYAFRDISSDRLVEQMKSDFVSSVSQELRRPLTSIYGFAATLLRTDVLFGDDERRTFLRYIASESERLTEIVDALLNVARLDTGDLQVDLAPTEIRPVIAEAVAAAENSLLVNDHTFVIDVPDESLVAEADGDRLLQVLARLLDNALKFSPVGGTVTVAGRRRRDAVEISVSDQGVGIAPAEQQRIFRKFYRADPGVSGAPRAGTGLGLFLARGLITAMGGRIWVASREGEGAKFTFELPSAAAGARADASEHVEQTV